MNRPTYSPVVVDGMRMFRTSDGSTFASEADARLYADPAPMFEHFYRPGRRTGDALAPCLVCGDSPTAADFGARHESEAPTVSIGCSEPTCYVEATAVIGRRAYCAFHARRAAYRW